VLRYEVRSRAGKTYRVEVQSIGSGPVAAWEISAWRPRRLGRDELLHVSYPVWSAQASSAGETEGREASKARDELIARMVSEPEAAWIMDRQSLLRVSNAVVISLGQELEALEAGSRNEIIPTETAIDYLGYGNKMAVHRAGLAPSR
jgi:hypothetical protein